MDVIGDNDAKWDENFDFDVWLKRYGPPISRDTQKVSGATNGKMLKEPDHGYVEGSSEWKRTVNCVRYGDATKEKNALCCPEDVWQDPRRCKHSKNKKVFPSISITKLSANTVKVRFEGDTWSFRPQFSLCGIHGRFENSDGQVVPSTATQEEKRNADYVRLIKSINVQGPKECGFLENLFGNIVYKTTMVRVTWIGTCAAEEPVHAFKTKLELLPNVCLRTESTVTNE